jgi:transmembrane sensor
MLIDKSRFEYLLKKYLDKTATEKEFNEFFSCVQQEEYKDVMTDLMKEEDMEAEMSSNVRTIDWDAMYMEIVTSTNNKTFSIRSLYRLTAAAVFLCFVGAGLYFNLAKGPNLTQVEQKAAKLDTAFNNNAILTLGDGHSVVLDAADRGTLTSQGGTTISKPEDGTLVYQAAANSSHEVMSNTLSTPRGGQYVVVLPDQTKAWLNSASSITFPTEFSTNERNVKVSGEVYFEVAKLAGKTFKVSTEHATVTVLGTHFNVMAYPDDQESQITLLEGSIRLKTSGAEKLLQPGQMASIQDDSRSIAITVLEMPKAKIDWKYGLFQFENESVQQIMKKISRWYNKDIVYEGRLIDKHFSGAISRKNSLSTVLNMLHASGDLDFKVSGETITVSDKK